MNKPLLVMFCAASVTLHGAVTAPGIVTIERDPYAVEQLDVRSRVEHMTVVDGVANVWVSFSREPMASPSAEFVFRNGSKSISVTPTEDQCSWPLKTTDVGVALNTYKYTFPLSSAIDASRIVPSRTVRFGGVTRSFESGGFLVVEDVGICQGRTWTGAIGGIERTFVGGVLLDPRRTVVAPPTPAPMMRSRSRMAAQPPRDTSTSIGGQKLAFPIQQIGEAQ